MFTFVCLFVMIMPNLSYILKGQSTCVFNAFLTHVLSKLLQFQNLIKRLQSSRGVYLVNSSITHKLHKQQVQALKKLSFQVFYSCAVVPQSAKGALVMQVDHMLLRQTHEKTLLPRLSTLKSHNLLTMLVMPTALKDICFNII